MMSNTIREILKSNNKKTILIQGGGGFIGSHLAKAFKKAGHFVICADIKDDDEARQYMGLTEYCHVYEQKDLTNEAECRYLINKYRPDIIAQLAALMGGMGYIGVGKNDCDIMTNSALINLNTCKAINSETKNRKISVDFENNRIVKEIYKPTVLFTSSACIYPTRNQLDPQNPKCSEDSAYPADCLDVYGWEKLFSEILYQTYDKNDILSCRIARLHNIFGPCGTWDGGKEKAPAALARKVVEANDGDEIEIWGSGEYTRSFLYIDECIQALIKLIESDFKFPINIGSEEMVTINELAEKLIKISGKKLTLKHIDGPLGVAGRNSDNTLIREKLGWDYKQSLEDGLRKLYPWIKQQVDKRAQS